MRLIALVLVLLLALALPVWADDVNFYVDFAVAVSGDGSPGSPLKLLSIINWTTIQNSINDGNKVYVKFKREASWTGESLAPKASGVSGPLILRAYGTGLGTSINN